MENIAKSLYSATNTVRLKHFPKGQIILYEHDVPSEAFIIKSGVVKIYDIDNGGNEKILHLAKSPSLIPFAFFSGDDTPLKWFYSALTDCEVYVVPIVELEKVFVSDPVLARRLVSTFSTDVHELLVRLSSLGKTSVRDKLIAALRFLQALHSTEHRGEWWRVNFPVNQQLLADISGVTRESVAIVMKDLQDEKIVRSPRLTTLEINRINMNGF